MQKTLARGIDQSYKLRAKMAKQEAAAKELVANSAVPDKAAAVDQACNTTITGKVICVEHANDTAGGPRAFKMRQLKIEGQWEESD